MTVYKGKCGSCRFRQHVVVGAGEGEKTRYHNECRRYPPQVIWEVDDFNECWPSVGLMDWCGEHQKEQNNENS